MTIASACPFAVGVKSETPPTSVAIAHLAPRLDVPVFGGLGGVGLLDELAAGSAGAMTGFSHPAVLAAVLRAHRDGGFEAARDAWAPWLPLANFEGQLRVGPGDPQRAAAATRGHRVGSGATTRRCRCPPRWFRCWISTSPPCPPTTTH